MNKIMRVIERLLAITLSIGVSIGCAIVLVQCPFAEPHLPPLGTWLMIAGLLVGIVMTAILVLEWFRSKD